MIQSFPEERFDSRPRAATEVVFRIYPRFFSKASRHEPPILDGGALNEMRRYATKPLL